MTPKEKAIELFNQYANVIYQRALTQMQYEICKQCALIAVDEILKIVNIWSALNMQKSSQVIFWLEVKEEIEKL